MDEMKTKLHNMVDSIDNPEILENLAKLLIEYTNYYLQAQKSEAS